MKTITYKIKGIRPMLQHNGRLANPLDEYTRKLKELTRQRAKTDEHHIAIAHAEFEGSLYWSAELGIYLPADNFDAMLVKGAGKFKLKNAVTAGVFVDCEYGVPITYDGPRSLAALWESPRHRFVKAVVVQRNRVMRTRPMIPTGWSAEVPVTFDEALIDADTLTQIVNYCGSSIGLGDWRPRFGRFVLEGAS